VWCKLRWFIQIATHSRSSRAESNSSLAASSFRSSWIASEGGHLSTSALATTIRRTAGSNAFKSNRSERNVAFGDSISLEMFFSGSDEVILNLESLGSVGSVFRFSADDFSLKFRRWVDGHKMKMA
jgi:hypothetical protein